jgi:transposase
MIASSVRIFVCSERQDMRRSFDALSLVVKQSLGEDPHSGALFCFVNKRGNRLKILWYDGNGHCILYKRGNRVRFVLPDSRVIDATQLSEIIRGINKDES